MSLKYLDYDVIHATSWDDSYPPQQLLPKDKDSSSEGGIKYGKGWQSSRLCTYPQEIILQVSCGAARIRRLQILSHHYKIATKLEIYVGSVQRRKEMVGMDTNTGCSHNEKKTLSWDKLPKIIDNDGISSDDDETSSEEDYDIVRTNGEHILFRRLGYCALDSNERANHKARELKSVRLDTEGEYIRLVARRCYDNQLNQHNQVGIVGITVMGEQADYLLAGESQKIPFEHADEGVSRVQSPETCIVPFIQDSCAPNDPRNFTPLYSILPNSSLSVPNNNSSTTTAIPLPNNTNNNQTNPVTANDFLSNGEETEKLLAAFGRAKQAAVKVEDFNLAKVLKYCTELVKKASEEVHKFEKLKRQAVVDEDFDNADKHKNEIESIREEIRGILTDEGLDWDESGEVVMCDPQDIIGLADDAELEYQQSSMDRSGARAPEPMFPKSRTNSDASINRYTDDRFQKAETMTYQPEPALSNLARSAFALSIEFFGDDVIARLLSKQCELIESALVDITKRIDIVDGEGLNVEGIDKLSLVKATYQTMQEALAIQDVLDEKLPLQVLNLWEKIIRFCIHHQIPNSSTWKLVDKNYELLFSKIADSNDRIKQSSISLFILLARTYRTPTQSVLSLVLKPAKTSSQSLKKAKPIVELIIRLVEIFGVIAISKVKFDKDNKLSLNAVMELSVSYLNNSDDEVRDTAVKLVFEVIKRMGREVVEPFLTEASGVDPLLAENIWYLISEWEEATGKIAGKARILTEDEKIALLKNYEVDEKLLHKPLAKRGTVGRMEQQLMEVRQMMNNTNHIIKDEFDDYLANTSKTNQDDMDEELLAAEEARLEAELAEEEEQLRKEEVIKTKAAAAATNKKTPATRGSKSAAPSKAPAKKSSKDDGKAAPTKKTSTSKSTSTSSKAKPASRGSTDDVKSAPKSGRKNSTQGKLTAESEDHGDKCCIFCDERDERFTEENLVTHYWNDCPVLINCRLCNIILEISTLDDHMLNDCDKSKFVKQCPRCREVIEADDYLEHMAKQSCMAIRQDIVRCPLCKATVKPATEQGWKAHLLDESGCTKNRRKSRPVATSMVKEMEAAAESFEKKSTTTTKSSTTSKAPARKPTSTSKDKLKKTSTTKVLKAKKNDKI